MSTNTTRQHSIIKYATLDDRTSSCSARCTDCVLPRTRILFISFHAFSVSIRMRVTLPLLAAQNRGVCLRRGRPDTWQMSSMSCPLDDTPANARDGAKNEETRERVKNQREPSEPRCAEVPERREGRTRRNADEGTEDSDSDGRGTTKSERKGKDVEWALFVQVRTPQFV